MQMGSGGGCACPGLLGILFSTISALLWFRLALLGRRWLGFRGLVRGSIAAAGRFRRFRQKSDKFKIKIKKNPKQNQKKMQNRNFGFSAFRRLLGRFRGFGFGRRLGRFAPANQNARNRQKRKS